MTDDIVSDKDISSCPSDNNDNNIDKWDDCIITTEDKYNIEHYSIDYVNTVSAVLSEFKIKSLPSGEMYIYQNNVYSPNGRNIISAKLDIQFGGYKTDNGDFIFKITNKSEIIEKVKSNTQTDINEFSNNHNILNIPNGLLNLENYELQEHTDEIITTSQINVVYNPSAKCPNFYKYLDSQVDKRYHDCISEIIGSILYPGYSTQKAIMFHGPKRTGKGTIIRVIEKLIGAPNISHISLQDLSGNRFARAGLFGKMLNTYGDLPYTTVIDTGIFKNITGEDTIEAEFKNKPRFSFKNSAKLLYSCNDIPELKVYDEAYCGRWILIPFEKTFYGKEDPSIEAKMTTPEELSGILNFGLDGLKRLQKNNWHFSYDVNYGLSQFKRKSNSIIAFLEDNYESSDSDYIPKANLLKDYNEWAKRNNMPPAPSKKAFGMKIQDQSIIPVDTITPDINSRRTECWIGIKKRSPQRSLLTGPIRIEA